MSYLNWLTILNMFRNKIFLFFILSFGYLQLPAQYVRLTTSNLPIVIINTNDGATIHDEPRIFAKMGIIWNKETNINEVTNPFNNFFGNISIEVRGSSSQMFPKKSYGVEIRDEQLLDADAALLDMPEEEDWILYAPYTDKSLIRNVLTFTLDQALGHYTPRCRFVELVINGEYQGLYVLMEKIKRDKNRVDIANLKSDDLEGEELTGGYIIKIDKSTGSGGQGFNSSFENKNGAHTYYQFEYPKQHEIRTEQVNYISNYIYRFEKSVFDKDFSSITGYRSLIEVTSFVDYMLINELAKNVDAYRLSTFFYKDKNEKLNIGPVWDFNLGYGNANYYDGWRENGFQFAPYLGTDNWQNPFWWEILNKDPYFNQRMVDRWKTLRENELSDIRINFVVDSLVALISEAKDRNFQKWNVINLWVWPNYYVGPTYYSEVTWMKNWIDGRLAWLDTNIPITFGVQVIDDDYLKGELVEVGPNPFNNQLKFYIKSGFKYPITLEIFNSSGTLVTAETVGLDRGLNIYEYPYAATLRAGFYYYRVLKGEKVLGTGKIAKMR